MIFFLSILILSFFGAAITVYLIKKRKAGERPVCILGKECHKVLESKYSKLLGVDNDVLGLIFYISIAFLTVLPLTDFGPQMSMLFFMAFLMSAGLLFSIVLIFVQWRIVKNWCFWCVVSSLITILIAVIFIYYFQEVSSWLI